MDDTFKQVEMTDKNIETDRIKIKIKKLAEKLYLISKRNKIIRKSWPK